MRHLAVYATVILGSCLSQAALCQSLPAVRNGQPAFSFEGGKRVSVQKNMPAGMQEYHGNGYNRPGTGVVEVGSDGLPARVGERAEILSPGHPSVPGNVNNIIRESNSNLVSTSKSAGQKSSAKKKPNATTVVQLLGPDGKMEYKEVKFVGELSANKRAPNITDVKDGEGKVKEYDWKKNGR